jgi:hypothetical protein
VFKLAGTAAAAPVDGVVTVVMSIEEAASLHMWQQGDEEMYTLQHVQERFFNRFHPEVVQLLSSVWWPTALRGLPIEGWDGDTLRTWSMPQRNHALMIVKLCRALLEPGEPWDAAEAERFACTAWEEDTKGTHVLNRIRFCDSIFEVADIWTLSTEADEYVAFLRRLMDAVDDDGVDLRIVKPGIDGGLVGHAAITDAAALPFEIRKDQRHERTGGHGTGERAALDEERLGGF